MARLRGCLLLFLTLCRRLLICLAKVFSQTLPKHGRQRIRKSVKHSKRAFYHRTCCNPCRVWDYCAFKASLEIIYSSHDHEILVSWQSLSILGIGVIFLCLTSTMFAMLQSIGKMNAPVKIMLLGVVIKLIGNIILVPIPAVNINGAAISTTLCYLIICILSSRVLEKELGTPIRLRKIFLPQIFSGILCAVGAFFAYRMGEFIVSGRLSTVISIIFGVIIYILSIVLMGGLNKNTVKSLLQ